jgi:MFS family permease
MVQRANGQPASGADRQLQLRRVRETSQAIMRGFNSMPIWSPLAIGFAVTTAAIPSLSWLELLPWAITVTLTYLLAGWLLDGFDWHSDAVKEELPVYSNWRSVRRFLALIAVVLLASTVFAYQADTRVSVGTAAIVPFAASLWIFWQYRRAGRNAPVLTLRRLRRRIPQVFPLLRTEICMVGGGALLGTLLAHLLHLQDVLPHLLPTDLPPVLLAGLLLVFILLLAQTGFGAIVGISIIASALPDPLSFGLQPLSLAVVFLTSWGVAAGITPSGATVSILARVTQTPASEIARHWNGRFTLIACILTLAWVALIQWLAIGASLPARML